MRSDPENGITVSSTARAPSAEPLRNAPDSAIPCCASNGNSCFKENININKSETPKLSLEPLQMKRKKKGGGYNLRKSLAWDRAFFTEEGILDPIELSTITDVSCREDEDLGKDRKKDWSSPKLDSSSSHLATSTSLTSYKFQTRLGGKPGSRCGDCPRPLPSPSLKRPANVNAGKAAGKELKLPKLHGLKPGSSPTCTATRSTILRTNHVKHNQIKQPDFSIQRHAEPKSSSKGLKNTKTASRANTPQSAHHSDGNSGNSSLKRYSSISMRTALVGKADNFASKNSDFATPIRPAALSEGQRYDSATSETPISQSAHISRKTVHPLQNIMAKPTGLRMPSPSLSFFSQPKPLVYRDLPQRNKETDVFGSQKPGNLRLPDNLRMPNLYSRITGSTVSSSKAVNSKPECLASSNISGIELITPNSEQNPMHRVGMKVLHDVINSHSIGKKILEGNSNVFYGQIQDLPKKNVIARISHEAELQKTSKQDCHEPHREKTGPLTYSLGETDKSIKKDNNVLKKKERESEQLGESQKNGSCCSGSIKALEQTENPYFGPENKRADLLKESSCLEAQTDNLPSGEAKMQNSVFASTIEGCENTIISMPEAGDDIKQCRKGSEVQNICHKVEMELEKTVVSNASDRLPPGQQSSFQNPEQEESDEKLLFIVPDGKDGAEVIGCKMRVSLSPARRLDSILGKENIISKPLAGIVFDSVDNSSSERNNSLMNTIVDCNDKHQGNANVSLNGAAHENLSSCLPESRICRLSQNDTLEKVTEAVPCIQDDSADNWLISTMALEDSESDTNNLRGLQGAAAVMLRSPESNMLDDRCPKQSDCMAFASDGFIAKNRVHNNDRLQTDGPADVYSEDNALGSTGNSVTGQDEMYLSTSKSFDLFAKESPSKQERCNDAYGAGDHIADAVTDPSRVESFSDTIKDEASEETDSCFNCLHPKLEHVKVEAALAPNDKHRNGLNENNLLLVLPQNAVPFSDEWLAAIEAAGEDILTRKSGAVQNSPPDKSLPEPSPWSPVKRKNNQIGPFDCTKFAVPSDSS